MPSTIHVLETAMLILVAFLAGCVIGYLARRLFAPKTARVAVEVQAPVSATGPQLVVAPTIAPVSRGPSPAQRLAAAAAGSAPPPDAAAAAPEVPMPVAAELAESEPAPEVMRPARRAGRATSGREVKPPLEKSVRVKEVLEASEVRAADPPREAMPAVGSGELASAPHANLDTAVDAPPDALIASPAIPAVEPEPPSSVVVAEEIPPIDEAAHVVEGIGVARAVAGTTDPAVGDDETFPEAPLPLADDTDPDPAVAARPAPGYAEDAEAAAMRAIEGGWTPRASVAPKQPAPEPDLPPGEMEAAMRSARSAVASAAAAADAAIGTIPEPDAATPLDFETTAASPQRSFLDTEVGASETSGLNFEPPAKPTAGFGRPAALAEPRDGAKDNLRQIRSVTPDLEHALNRLGIFHFDQVAAWDQKAVVWLDQHLSLRGRIGREKWVEQARTLARGHHGQARPVRH